MFTSLQIFYVENLMSKAKVLGGGAFERSLGHEGGTLINIKVFGILLFLAQKGIRCF